MYEDFVIREEMFENQDITISKIWISVWKKNKKFKGFTYKYTRACIPRMENTATSRVMRKKNDLKLIVGSSKSLPLTRRMKRLTKSKKGQTEHNSCNNNESQSSAKNIARDSCYPSIVAKVQVSICSRIYLRAIQAIIYAVWILFSCIGKFSGSRINLC